MNDLKTDLIKKYDSNLDEVFSIMDNIKKYQTWLNEASEKLNKAQFRSKVLEEQIAELYKSESDGL